MNERVVVDPITRIEGHLRIEAQMDGDRIADAYSSGTMVRGIEIILRGRDPRDAWAFAQRICGVCTLVHGIASVRAVEDALKYEIPKNAQLIRNMMIGAQYVHDHVMHFYHLHALDWVDVVSALQADPKATSELAQSISNYPKSSPGYFSDMKAKLQKFVEAGQLGIFAKAYWGHPAYKLPPEANLMAVSHYLEALTWQRDVAKMLVLFPFEEEIYREASVPVAFVGHPLVDHVAPLADRGAVARTLRLDPNRPVIAAASAPTRASAPSFSTRASDPASLFSVIATAGALPASLLGPLLALPAALTAGAASLVMPSASIASTSAMPGSSPSLKSTSCPCVSI